MARIVIPGVPHHVTQCGNRRQDVISGDGDDRLYIVQVFEAATKPGCEI